MALYRTNYPPWIKPCDFDNNPFKPTNMDVLKLYNNDNDRLSEFSNSLWQKRLQDFFVNHYFDYKKQYNEFGGYQNFLPQSIRDYQEISRRQVGYNLFSAKKIIWRTYLQAYNLKWIHDLQGTFAFS